jgi:hypothetical protein
MPKRPIISSNRVAARVRNLLFRTLSSRWRAERATGNADVEYWPSTTYSGKARRSSAPTFCAETLTARTVQRLVSICASVSAHRGILAEQDFTPRTHHPKYCTYRPSALPRVAGRLCHLRTPCIPAPYRERLIVGRAELSASDAEPATVQLAWKAVGVRPRGDACGS